ncbi:23S rRNA (adenine(2030)-N(6))-methyltransferase RlmJ [uncultured Paraglaciecola sp.]|uniref:23S rRNA (adenine(2030)-N(6))-methyltransferase RlmJ n=1 Tax=uncultured Paraglaciecola sp. TaxID=1765024 RepID=UPI0025F4775B|nr:23S rRNA (adenine(2030)-N(6))-methyltransferase RlmJ [uncultured Paraglaciecola sp.]
MLSYRHSFHAGNHGDVLKHICQMLIIDKLKSKEKGFCYFDTHSGAGVYQLNSQESLKTKEFKQGIERITGQSIQNEAINHYLSLVSNYMEFNQYPGSPEIAKSMLREQDKMVLMEWHNQEIQNLKSNIGGKNIAVHHRDGYEGLVALTPPNMQRGMVLIDPSYEVASEYQQVVDTVAAVSKKWNSAIYAIWYPLIADRQVSNADFDSSVSKKGKSEAMLEALSQQSFKNMLKIELCVTDGSKAGGMYGSGMLLINAPWQLDVQIKESLQALTPLMAQNNSASYSVDWLIEE